MSPGKEQRVATGEQLAVAIDVSHAEVSRIDRKAKRNALAGRQGHALKGKQLLLHDVGASWQAP